VRRAIRAAGARLFFLPQYSPDLNPIEQVFAKLKTLLRKAGERTVEATWRRIGTLLDSFSPQECASYFRNSGYASKQSDQTLAQGRYPADPKAPIPWGGGLGVGSARVRQHGRRRRSQVAYTSKYFMFYCPGDTSPLVLLHAAESHGDHRNPYRSPGTRPLPPWAMYELTQRIIASCRRIGHPAPVYLSEDNAGILTAIAQVLGDPVVVEDIAAAETKAVDFIEDISGDPIDSAIPPYRSIFGQ
jgi:hypothetical protein